MIERIVSSLDVLSVIIVGIFFIILGYRPPWWSRKQNFFKNENKKIPGPLSLPILGTRWLFTFGQYNFGKIHEFYKDLYIKYGPLVKEEALFNIPVISVFEKKDIEKVLKSSGKYPIRPPTEAISQYRKSKPERYATTGIVNEQGETWQFLRSTLTSEFTSPKTIFSFIPQIEEIADDWCNLIYQLRNENNKIEHFEHTIRRLGLEAICALVLGRRMGFLLTESETEITTKLADAVHKHFIACRDTYFGLPIWKFFETAAYKQLSESEEVIYKLVLDLIKSADDATKESAVFQSIISANLDEREKTAAIVDFIAAGIHTLKNSLTFLLYTLAYHSNTQEKILADKTNSYLRACINETFRLFPTANCLARINEKDLELSGFHIRPGTVLLCHTGIACRSESNFKNANEFRPERWLDEDKLETFSNATFLVIPFGIGKRICPGKRFIEHVLPIIVERTLSKFSIEVNDELMLKFEFLLSPEGPITMTFNDRE